MLCLVNATLLRRTIEYASLSLFHRFYGIQGLMYPLHFYSLILEYNFVSIMVKPIEHILSLGLRNKASEWILWTVILPDSVSATVNLFSDDFFKALSRYSSAIASPISFLASRIVFSSYRLILLYHIFNSFGSVIESYSILIAQLNFLKFEKDNLIFSSLTEKILLLWL